MSEGGEEFEDTKGVIRIHISKKNRQRNGQKKKYKITNNPVQVKFLEHGYRRKSIIICEKNTDFQNLTG